MFSKKSAQFAIQWFPSWKGPCVLYYVECECLNQTVLQMEFTELEPNGPTENKELHSQDSNQPATTMRAFYPLVLASQVAVVLVLILAGYWTGHYLGGFAWDGSAKEFNLHPLLMILGLVFFYGDAILMFRIFRKENKTVVKVIHMLMQSIAIICGIIALKAVFRFHNKAGIPNMYTLHSWVGLPVFVLFCLQYIGGFVSFFFPKLNETRRAAVLPYHKFFGVTLLGLVCVTALTGINNKLFFAMPGGEGKDKYSSLPSQAYVGNFLGLAIVIYAVFVGFLVTFDEYKREQEAPNPEKLPLTTAEMKQFQTMDPADPSAGEEAK
ncbi:cytochrome b561-like isoform X2 [Patiria miniata]|uniref:Cytochrome b561 domain-containing protein n=1 Tax=Patiria miniata TaxID=46514 RepID=A0A913YXU1_PATMI|nr:cytochrome b561-like isoform X2 [Patiria miniata]